MDDATRRAALEQSLSRLTDRTLMRYERYGHLALVFFAGTMAGMLGYLVVQESGLLPPGARVPLAIMALVALAWTVFAVRALACGWVGSGPRDIVAARMTLAFSTLFTIGVAATSASLGGRMVTGASTMAAVMVALAGVLVIRAQRRVGRLRALRDRLERDLAASA